MEFFNSAVDTLQTIVVGLGGALCVWGGINLLEGYGQDNPGSKSPVSYTHLDVYKRQPQDMPGLHRGYFRDPPHRTLCLQPDGGR